MNKIDNIGDKLSDYCCGDGRLADRVKRKGLKQRLKLSDEKRKAAFN